MARPWFAFYPADYLAKTTSLTTELHGAYMLLLMAYWANGGPLADDQDELAAICRMTPEAFERAKNRLCKLFVVADGVWANKRMDEEIAKTTGMIAKKSAAGKASAEQKRQQKGNTSSTGVDTDAKQNGQQNTQQNTQQKGNQPQPQLPSSSERESQASAREPFQNETKNGKTEDDWPAMPECLNAALRPNFRFVAGGAKQFAGLGEREKSHKPPDKADRDMAAHLTANCGMEAGAAWTLLMAARDPESPDHTDAARTCERESRKHKLGWFHAEAVE